MDSELLTCSLKFVEYFPDYLSALSRTLLRFFGQPLSKQLYIKGMFCRRGVISPLHGCKPQINTFYTILPINNLATMAIFFTFFVTLFDEIV